MTKRMKTSKINILLTLICQSENVITDTNIYLFIYLLNLKLISVANFFLINLFLFLAALGLHCCTRAFSSCGEQGLLFVAVHGFLIAGASLAVEHRL